MTENRGLTDRLALFFYAKIKSKEGQRRGSRRRAHSKCENLSLLLFLHKDVLILIFNGTELVRRLMKCGYTESSATDICQKYAADGDFSGLLKFIKFVEMLMDDQKQYV